MSPKTPAPPTRDPWDIEATATIDEPSPRQGPSGEVQATVSLCADDLAPSAPPLPFTRRADAPASAPPTRPAPSASAALPAGFVSPRAHVEQTAALSPEDLLDVATASGREAVGAPFPIGRPDEPARLGTVPDAPWSANRSLPVAAPEPGQQATVALAPEEVEHALAGGSTPAAAPAHEDTGSASSEEPTPPEPRLQVVWAEPMGELAIDARASDPSTHDRAKIEPLPAVARRRAPTARIYSSLAGAVRRK